MRFSFTYATCVVAGRCRRLLSPCGTCAPAFRPDDTDGSMRRAARSHVGPRHALALRAESNCWQDACAKGRDRSIRYREGENPRFFFRLLLAMGSQAA